MNTLTPTDSTSALTNLPKHLPTKTVPWANYCQNDKHGQYDPTTNTTELTPMTPTKSTPPLSPTNGNKVLDLALTPYYLHSNLTVSLTASPQSMTAIHFSISDCITDIQKQLEAIQLSLHNCTAIMKNHCQPHKLQDCPLTDSPQALSISQLMAQSDPRAPPPSTTLPVPSLLIDFLMYGQPWHTHPILSPVLHPFSFTHTQLQSALISN